MAKSDPGPARYPHLFSPFVIGGLTLPNRMVVPGLTTGFGAPGGDVTDRLCRYLAARARGGFGLVVTENLAVDPAGRALQTIVMAESDERLPGLTRLARAVHDEGGLVFGQLVHAGRQTRSAITGAALVAPSAIPCPINRETPRALETQEVEALERAFVDAACRLEAAGYDGVEIHAAHGYLVAGFLSPYSNAREDAYGGSFKNRMRFLANIVAGVRARCRPGFPLSVRISADEFVEGGLTTEDAIRIANALEAMGVDALSVSVGVYESFNRLSMVSGEPEGQWLPLAGEVKRGTSLPIIGVGRIIRADVAERALTAGDIDLAAFGRASMADPDLPAKVRAGKEDEIIVCLGCNLCLGRAARPESICPVNPELGREGAFELAPAETAHKVAVLGDSLAALTFAWLAARRGHAVTLYEDEGLPGLWRLRACVPGQEVIAEAAAAMRRRARAEGVRFDKGGPAGAAVTVVARRFRPYAPAITAGDVTSRDPTEVLAAPPEASRALVFGDDLASAEAAILLAERGAAVSLRLPGKGLAVDAHPGFREVAARELAARKVAIEPNAPPDPAAPPDLAALAGADLVVLGRTAPADDDDPALWTAPEIAAEAPLWLADAYEPGAMATGIYTAVDAAIALGARRERAAR